MVSVYQVLWITVHLNLKNLNKTKQLVYVSATPGPYEIEHTDKMVEQIIRPTGLLDPKLMFDLRRIKLMIYSVKFKKELIGMNVCLLQP